MAEIAQARRSTVAVVGLGSIGGAAAGCLAAAGRHDVVACVRRPIERLTLERQHVTVTTPWGEVRVKLGSLDGVVCNAAPEFEDCRRLAAGHNVPLKQVMQEALRSYFSRQDQVVAPAPPAR